MKSRTSDDQPEFSRPVVVDKISAGGVEQNLVADNEECRLLATRFGLLDLPKLTALLTVKPARGGRMFEVKGRMEADVVQQCVVTLEPLPAHIGQDIQVLYATPDLLETETSHLQVDMEAEETEPVVNGIIDVGELIAQHLGIALDPWPRKPGLAYVEAEYGGGAEERPNPFAKLASLTKTGKEKK